MFYKRLGVFESHNYLIIIQLEHKTNQFNLNDSFNNMLINWIENVR